MSGEAILPDDPRAPMPVVVTMANGIGLIFTGPAAQVLQRAGYGDFLAPLEQEPDVND